jgi:hypothetical protein
VIREPKPYRTLNAITPTSEWLSPQPARASSVPAAPSAMIVKSTERSAPAPIIVDPRNADALNTDTTTDGSRSEGDWRVEAAKEAKYKLVGK